jgi:hypothetical protein
VEGCTEDIFIHSENAKAPRMGGSDKESSTPSSSTE